MVFFVSLLSRGCVCEVGGVEGRCINIASSKTLLANVLALKTAAKILRFTAVARIVRLSKYFYI